MLIWDELDREVKANQPATASDLETMLQKCKNQLTEKYLMSFAERLLRICFVIPAKGLIPDASTFLAPKG